MSEKPKLRFTTRHTSDELRFSFLGRGGGCLLCQGFCTCPCCPGSTYHQARCSVCQGIETEQEQRERLDKYNRTQKEQMKTIEAEILSENPNFVSENTTDAGWDSGGYKLRFRAHQIWLERQGPATIKGRPAEY